MRSVLAGSVTLAAGLLLVASGCGGVGTSPQISSKSLHQTVFASHSFTIPIYPRNDPRGHVAGPNIAIQPGVPVMIRFVNHTRETHTFTVPALGINAVIRPGSAGSPVTTPVTVKSSQRGVFKWFCVYCHDHPMGGEVYAIVG